MPTPHVTEIVSESGLSFEDATKSGIARARRTMKNVCGAWIARQTRVAAGNGGAAYRVTMKVTFLSD